jgi:hypothetical protein
VSLSSPEKNPQTPEKSLKKESSPKKLVRKIKALMFSPKKERGMEEFKGQAGAATEEKGNVDGEGADSEEDITALPPLPASPKNRA